MISKTLKNSFKDSNESKLALAFAAYRASIWGEAQKIIDLIPRKEWDIRVLKLYEKLSNENSKIVLMGDTDQIDTPYIDKRSNGLSIVIDRLKDSDLTAHVHLPKGERSSLATLASRGL